jgi:rhodanese-related sulfurtransferase
MATGRASSSGDGLVDEQIDVGDISDGVITSEFCLRWALAMSFCTRIAIIFLAAVGAAAAGNAVHPKRIAWFVTRDVIYPPLTPDQAAAGITRDELVVAIQQGATIVDARKPDEFGEGHIPGAINMPAEDPNSSLDSLRERATPEDLVTVYCGGQSCDDSRIVFDLLKANGFQNVRLYSGGWRDWTEAKLDVEK